MTADVPGTGDAETGRLANGLLAATYVPLTDVETDIGRALLVALGRARIAAYLAPLPTEGQTTGQTTEDLTTQERRRLYVNAEERADARTIVAAAVRALGGGAEELPPAPAPDPLAAVDTDKVFAELVADWHVDTVAAIRAAERELSEQDEDWRARLEQPAAEEPVWLDDDHYVPPPPPPLPRLSGPTIGAILLMLASIAILAVGSELGLVTSLRLLLGIAGLLTGAGILLMRLHEDRDEDEGDGAVL